MDTDFLLKDPKPFRAPDIAHVGLMLMRAHGNITDAADMAERAFGGHGAAQLLRKAAASVGSTGDGSWGSALAAEDSTVDAFRERVAHSSAFGRIAELAVPVNTPMLVEGEPARGGWRGEARPIRVSSLSLETKRLEGHSIGCLLVFSKELARARFAAARIRRALERAAVLIVDEALLDPANDAIPGVRPAAITHDAPTIAASGSLIADLKAAFSAFAGEVNNAFFAAHPRTCIALGLACEDGAALFPDAGARGGSVLGVPLVATPGSPEGQLTLIDPTGILCADEGVDLAAGSQASVELDDAPTDGDPVLVGLWQRNLESLRLIRFVDWKRVKDGSVVVLTGV